MHFAQYADMNSKKKSRSEAILNFLGRVKIVGLLGNCKQTIYYMGLDTRKPVFGVSKHQMCRPACAYAQTEQHLCCLLFGKYHIS